MKKFVSILLAMAATLMLPSMTSCETLTNELVTMAEELEAAQAGLAADDSESADSEGYYDAEGNPIYGYDGEQAVYGYESNGSPVYDVASLSSSSTVPTWSPLAGARPQPAGVRRGDIPQNASFTHGRSLHRPAVSRVGHGRRHYRHVGTPRGAHRDFRNRHHGNRTVGAPNRHHGNRTIGAPNRHHGNRTIGAPNRHHGNRTIGAPNRHHGNRTIGARPAQRHAGRPTLNRAKDQKKVDTSKTTRPAGRRNPRG